MTVKFIQDEETKKFLQEVLLKEVGGIDYPMIDEAGETNEDDEIEDDEIEGEFDEDDLEDEEYEEEED